MKTDPQSNPVSSAPDSRGPSAEIAPPSAHHRAIAFVRSGPDHSAVIRASVVGKAIPAANPPTRRAAKRTAREGANAAGREAGVAIAGPAISIILRPYRSPSAPK